MLICLSEKKHGSFAEINAQLKIENDASNMLILGSYKKKMLILGVK